MKIELTKQQVNALIDASMEIQAGNVDHWDRYRWRALVRATEKLGDAFWRVRSSRKVAPWLPPKRKSDTSLFTSNNDNGHIRGNQAK